MIIRQAARPDDLIRVLAMPSGVVKGLPEEEVDFLLRSVGEFGRIESVSADGLIEVELRNEVERRIHFVWMSPPDIEVVGPARAA